MPKYFAKSARLTRTSARQFRFWYAYMVSHEQKRFALGLVIYLPVASLLFLRFASDAVVRNLGLDYGYPEGAMHSRVILTVFVVAIYVMTMTACRHFANRIRDVASPTVPRDLWPPLEHDDHQVVLIDPDQCDYVPPPDAKAPAYVPDVLPRRLTYAEQLRREIADRQRKYGTADPRNN